MKLFNIGFFLSMSLLLTISSCQKEEKITEENLNYANEVILRTNEEAALGRNGCYELVFPVVLTFPDGVTTSVDSYENMRKTIARWRFANPRVRAIPTIAFPFDVLTKEGRVITIENQNQLLLLRRTCIRNVTGNNGHLPCYTLGYPFTLLINLNGSLSTSIINNPQDRMSLHTRIQNFIAANPSANVSLDITFPMTAILTDGTRVTVNSRQELADLKDSCD